MSQKQEEKSIEQQPTDEDPQTQPLPQSSSDEAEQNQGNAEELENKQSDAPKVPVIPQYIKDQIKRPEIKEKELMN